MMAAMTPDLALQLSVDSLAAAGVYALVASGIQLAHAGSRVLHLAAGDAALAGAVAGAALAGRGLPLPLAIALALGGGAATGAVLEVLVVRPSAVIRPALAVALLALTGVVVRGAISAGTGGEVQTLPSISTTWAVGAGTVHAADVLAVAASAGVAAALTIGLARTRAGAALRVTAAEPAAAELAGVDTAAVRTWAFAAAGLLAALAVVLAAGRVPLGAAAAVPLTLKGLAAVSVGGLRSPLTAASGALGIGVVEVWGGHWLGGGAGQALVYGAGAVALALRGSGR